MKTQKAWHNTLRRTQPGSAPSTVFRLAAMSARHGRDLGSCQLREIACGYDVASGSSEKVEARNLFASATFC
jgi:hypothetical protein